ncbi:MAG: tetratricopeptide repeat protein, partial [Calditrichaeota bacterium]
MPNTEHFAPTDRIGQLLLTLGNAYLDRQQYEEAFEKFEQLVDRNVDSADIWHKAAVSGIGANNVSDKALTIYKKAMEDDPDSSALKIGVATLFAQNEIVTPYSIEICETALTLNPANAQKLHLFLKKAYEESGQQEKVYEHEQKVIFGSNNKKAIRSYLESLWWEHKFDEANRSITTAMDSINPAMQFQLERALTLSYELHSKGKLAQNKLERSTIKSGLDSINPEQSLQALRSFLMLKVCQPDAEESTRQLDEELLEEYQFILGNVSLTDVLMNTNGNSVPENEDKEFNFQTNVLELFPAMDIAGQDFDEANTRTLCLMQIFTHGSSKISEKLVKLVEDHLLQSN